MFKNNSFIRNSFKSRRCQMLFLEASNAFEKWMPHLVQLSGNTANSIKSGGKRIIHGELSALTLCKD